MTNQLRSAADADLPCIQSGQVDIQTRRLVQLTDRLGESLAKLFDAYSSTTKPPETNRPPDGGEPTPPMSDYASRLAEIGDRLYRTCNDIDDFTSRCDL